MKNTKTFKNISEYTYSSIKTWLADVKVSELKRYPKLVKDFEGKFIDKNVT